MTFCVIFETDSGKKREKLEAIFCIFYLLSLLTAKSIFNFGKNIRMINFKNILEKNAQNSIAMFDCLTYFLRTYLIPIKKGLYRKVIPFSLVNLYFYCHQYKIYMTTIALFPKQNSCWNILFLLFARSLLHDADDIKCNNELQYMRVCVCECVLNLNSQL